MNSKLKQLFLLALAVLAINPIYVFSLERIYISKSVMEFHPFSWGQKSITTEPWNWRDEMDYRRIDRYKPPNYVFLYSEKEDIYYSIYMKGEPSIVLIRAHNKVIPYIIRDGHLENRVSDYSANRLFLNGLCKSLEKNMDNLNRTYS